MSGPDAVDDSGGRIATSGDEPAVVTGGVAVADPYASGPLAPRWAYLHRLNPLAKVGAVLPAMVLLMFTRDLATPAAFLVLSYLVLFTGARLSGRVVAILLLAMPLGMAVLGLGFSLWADPAQVASSPVVLRVGDWTLRTGALLIGAATALRLGAILSLGFLGGLTTTGPDLVRASVQQLRVPYRIGYAALAAYRFVPRFGHELAVIRAAHRVRGHGSGFWGGRGPLARLARGWGYIVPLLAGAIRHAERVALAMDSRAFGAYPTRTERHLVPFRARDVVFIAVTLLVCAAVFWILFPWQPS